MFESQATSRFMQEKQKVILGSTSCAVFLLFMSLHASIIISMDKDAWQYLFSTQFPGRTLVVVNAVVMARRVAQVRE